MYCGQGCQLTSRRTNHLSLDVNNWFPVELIVRQFFRALRKSPTTAKPLNLFHERSGGVFNRADQRVFKLLRQVASLPFYCDCFYLVEKETRIGFQPMRTVPSI